jgi:hypothetical protein
MDKLLLYRYRIGRIGFADKEQLWFIGLERASPAEHS